ncbi:MAG: FliH/SctL family protein, partial [Alphaproteobacteria bacterium]
HLRTDMPKVALAAARKAAGKALDDNAAATLNDTVQRCLATISDEPEITVIIHDSMAEALEKHLQTLAKQYPVAARVRVSGQSDIPASDCRISWKDGAFLRDTNQIWQNIGQAVEQIGAGEHFAAGQELEALPQTAQPVETKPQPPASTDTAPVAQDQPPSEE